MSTELEIIHRELGHKGEFVVIHEGVDAAKMTYTMAGETTMIIDHTEVSDALRGTGAGKQLVKRGVEYAEEKALKLIPLCPFAKSVIERGL